MTATMPLALVKHVRKEIATWREMDYDRVLVLDGLTWRRVKDGFGGLGDREDWVLEVPGYGISVSRFHGLLWGQSPSPSARPGGHERREDAMRAKVKGIVGSVQTKIGQVRRELELLETTKALLTTAIIASKEGG